MSIRLHSTLLSALLVLAGNLSTAAQDAAQPREPQIGPRPFYLVDKMSPSTLKRKLEQCEEHPFFYKTDFTIGHRGGGTLQFPGHTKESHEAGARMVAGIQECDVTFTKDGELVMIITGQPSQSNAAMAGEPSDGATLS